MSDVPNSEELSKWVTQQGLDDFEDSEFIVNEMRVIDENTLKITAFTNVYLKNGDVYSATVRFEIEKRKKGANK